MIRSWRARIWVLLIWTAGVVAIWAIADVVLNPGVTDEDIRECMEEGIVPPRECEDTLRRLEADDDPVIGIWSSFVIWLAGCLLLLWAVPRQRRPESS